MSEAFTILVSTDAVIINDMSRTVDCSALVPARTHAVQWDGSAGHIEFYNPPGLASEDVKLNEPLTSMGAYQSYVDAWYAAAPPPPGPMPVYRDANARLDAGIDAAIDSVDRARASLLIMPPHSTPPTVDELQAQVDYLAAQVLELAQANAAMLEAQAAPPPEANTEET